MRGGEGPGVGLLLDIVVGEDEEAIVFEFRCEFVE